MCLKNGCFCSGTKGLTWMNEQESLNTRRTVNPCIFCFKGLVLLLIWQHFNNIIWKSIFHSIYTSSSLKSSVIPVTVLSILWIIFVTKMMWSRLCSLQTTVSLHSPPSTSILHWAGLMHCWPWLQLWTYAQAPCWAADWRVLTDIFNSHWPEQLSHPSKPPPSCRSTAGSLDDFHPVALTPTIMKCFKGLVLVHPTYYINRFTSRQNRRTEDAISTALYSAASHLDNVYVRMLFINYSSAFNTMIPSINWSPNSPTLASTPPSETGWWTS